MLHLPAMHPLFIIPELAMSAARPYLLPLFKWKVSSWVIPILVGVALTAAGLVNQFWLAYVLWIVSGLWGLLAWLVSDRLQGLRPRPNRSARRHGNQLREWRRYVAYKFFASLAIIILTIACVHLTRTYELYLEREDVLAKLQVIYTLPRGEESNPFHTVVTIRNGSKFDIGPRHRTACYIQDSRMNDGNSSISRLALAQLNGKWQIIGYLALYSGTGIEETTPIKGGDDAESRSCLSGMDFRNYQCVDMTIVFQYFLTSQPDAIQVKQKRIVTRRNAVGGFEWFEQNVEAKQNFCEAS